MHILNADLTKHPKIYSYVYWGGLIDQEGSFSTKDIVNNRNQLIMDYGITKIRTEPIVVHKSPIAKVAPPSGWVLSGLSNHPEFGSIVDHMEIYGTKTKGRVLLLSPYLLQDHKAIVKAITPEEDEGLGMKVAPVLYNAETTTLIRTFSDTKAFKDWLIRIWIKFSDDIYNT